MRQPQNEARSNSTMIGIAMLKVWAMSLYLPMRIQSGRDHAGYIAILGVPFIYFWSQFARAPILLWLIPINLVCMFCEAVRRRSRFGTHSEYGGYPWLAMFLTRTKDERAAKLIGEPGIAFLLGMVAYQVQADAAPFFWWGALVLFFNQCGLQAQEERHVSQIMNGMIENEYYRTRLRERRGR